MNFAFTPDTPRPPRLIRFVKPGTLIGENTLAVYDQTNNLLFVDEQLYAMLNDIDRHIVLRTHALVLVVTYDSYGRRTINEQKTKQTMGTKDGGQQVRNRILV
jgi:hypothetical protein